MGGSVIRVFRVKLPEEKAKKFEELIESGLYMDALRHGIDLLLKNIRSNF